MRASLPYWVLQRGAVDPGSQPVMGARLVQPLLHHIAYRIVCRVRIHECRLQSGVVDQPLTDRFTLCPLGIEKPFVCGTREYS